MGLAGGSHCLAMCSAPCVALVGQGGAPPAEGNAEQVVRWAPRGGILQRTVAFHAGRLVGYASAGALAALAMDSLAWLTQQTTALRPAWTLMHLSLIHI